MQNLGYVKSRVQSYHVNAPGKSVFGVSVVCNRFHCASSERAVCVFVVNAVNATP